MRGPETCTGLEVGFLVGIFRAGKLAGREESPVRQEVSVRRFRQMQDPGPTLREGRGLVPTLGGETGPHTFISCFLVSVQMPLEEVSHKLPSVLGQLLERVPGCPPDLP